jgi:hypothetical protein
MPFTRSIDGVQINITGVGITWKTMKQFAEQQPNLHAFTFCNSPTVDEKALWYLLRGCRNLRRLNLTACRRLAGRAFMWLGPALEQVAL